MAEHSDKKNSNLRATEAMLERSILERRKPLAELALATLVEMAPNHPRRRDYETWVQEIDREAQTQARFEQEAEAGRRALYAQDWPLARQHLQRLRKLDAIAAEGFATELSAAEQEQAADDTIGQRKEQIEALLAAGLADEAETEIAHLGELGATKITSDFLRRRVAEVRQGQRHRVEIQALEEMFDRRLKRRDWGGAREVAHRLGELGGSDTRSLFERLSRDEAEQRRQQSIAQGLSTLERFIAQGRRAEAQLALQVLGGLEMDPRQLQLCQQRVNRL